MHKVIDLQIIGFKCFAVETIRKTHREVKRFDNTWNSPRHAIHDLKALPFNPKLHCFSEGFSLCFVGLAVAMRAHSCLPPAPVSVRFL